jgi:hypothetical protein
MFDNTIPPTFFVPYAKDAAQAERVWQATKVFMGNQGHNVHERRIYSIRYYHNGKECFDKIGGMDRYGFEEILVLLETDSVYLCCTQNRGVIRGEPILIGKHHSTHVVEFRES